jgi:hypothetical protein
MLMVSNNMWISNMTGMARLRNPKNQKYSGEKKTLTKHISVKMKNAVRIAFFIVWLGQVSNTSNLTHFNQE